MLELPQHVTIFGSETTRAAAVYCVLCSAATYSTPQHRDWRDDLLRRPVLPRSDVRRELWRRFALFHAAWFTLTVPNQCILKPQTG